MANYAGEYTPELNKEYLAGLLAPIEEAGAEQEGRARSEAAARGLEGQAMAGSMIQGARSETARQKAATISKFNFDVAGLSRAERLTKEQEAYQSSEAEKQREEQEKLTKMGFEFQDQQREAARRASSVIGPQQVLGLTAGLIGSGISGATGGYFGTLAAKK